MNTHLCLTQLLNRPTRRPLKMNTDPRQPHTPRTQGQVLVIFAVSLVALLLFIGLAVDAGSLYLTYDQLKRAVDASAVSAANDFKRGVDINQMTTGAEEVLKLHNVDLDQTTLQVYTCESDPNLSTDVPTFYNLCPQGSESKRKLVWVQATEKAPLYFLTLLGVPPVSLTTNSISEAAPIDLVIVLDTSSSMAGAQDASGHNLTPGYGDGYNPDAAGACNSNNTCYPLRYAKDAAKTLIDKGLYQNYDRVAVVTFAQKGTVVQDLTYTLGQGGTGGAETTIDTQVKLHYDPPFNKLWANWTWVDPATSKSYYLFNPVNPEDRNGDGSDTDNTAFTTQNGSFPVCAGYPDPEPADAGTNPNPLYANCCLPNLPSRGPGDHPDRWDYTKNPFGWGGVPCDDNGVNDSYNWSLNTNGQGPYDKVNDPGLANAWKTSHPGETLSPLSTCSGCGIRIASNILKSEGRPTAVWLMVFLSDGGANMSDTPATDLALFPGALQTAYPNGFCSGVMGTDGTMRRTAGAIDPKGLWYDGCVDPDIHTRECINASQSTCPNSYTTGANHWTTVYDAANNDTTGTANMAYSPLDYALDMTDQAALTVVKPPTGANAAYYNTSELIGNDIAIYSVGLGAAGYSDGEKLLRYMAAVGDDGDRVTDPCDRVGVGVRTSCGNYYWDDGSANALTKIFEDIASRIYTRITG